MTNLFRSLVTFLHPFVTCKNMHLLQPAMGAWFSRKRRSRRLVMIGPASAGKTTLLYHFKLGEHVQAAVGPQAGHKSKPRWLI